MAKPPKKTKATQKPEIDLSQRQKALRPISATLPRLTKRLTGKRGFAEAGLVDDWVGIVGADLAAQCLPVKLRFPRQGVRNDGTLILRVDPAFALEIQHQEQQLLERINSHFGYRAVAKLSLQQGPLPKARPKEKPVIPPLPPEERARIHEEFADVESDSLREALERLAGTLRAKQKKET